MTIDNLLDHLKKISWKAGDKIFIGLPLTNNNRNYRLNSSLKARAWQQTAGLMSICPQTEVKGHLACLGVLCDEKLCSLLSALVVSG